VTGPSADNPAGIPEPLVPAAEALFGDRLPLARRYAELLVTDGVVRGLIGPREAPRIWDRHLLNCAVLTELVPEGAYVIDVGSGAGLPGIVLAVARPDLAVVLLEPLARRVVFLTLAVAELGLAERVSIVRSRAEDWTARRSDAGSLGGALADVVTARALAPLDRLVGWCLPLVAPGGRLLAVKGESAAAEVAEHAAAFERLGGSAPVVRRIGQGLVDPPATVVEIVRRAAPLLTASAKARTGGPAGRIAAPPSRRGRGGRGGRRS
jgi:16S rRNA (guanine527-N7)-methyltransferase